MVWDGLVAVDLFFAGLGAWTFIFTAFASGNKAEASRIKLVGYLISLVAVGLGALILAVDAHAGLLNPMRFFYLLTNFGSVMTWGVLLISLFMIAAFVCVVFLLMKKPVPKIAEWIGAVCGLGVSLYTGILLSVSCAYPLWNPLILPLLFLVSAALSGYAAFSLVARLTAAKTYERPSWFGPVALILPLAGLVLTAALVALTATTSGSGAAAAAATTAGLMSGEFALLFWGGLVLVGFVVPLALSLVTRLKGTSTPAWIGYTEWICILIGGFILRYVVVVAAVSLFA